MKLGPRSAHCGGTSVPSLSNSNPSRTDSQTSGDERRSVRFNAGCPSAVANDNKYRSSLSARLISGSRPNKLRPVTREPRSKSKAGSQSSSSLQLPQIIDAGPSMRQLHSMESVSSPIGRRGRPCSGTHPGERAPNSKKIAEPYPLQRWPTSIPTRSAATRLKVSAGFIAGEFGGLNGCPQLGELPPQRSSVSDWQLSLDSAGLPQFALGELGARSGRSRCA